MWFLLSCSEMWLLIQTLIKYRCDFESQETLIKDNQTKISDLSSENEKLIKDTSLQVSNQGYKRAENTPKSHSLVVFFVEF